MVVIELNRITPYFRIVGFDGYCSIAHYVYNCNNHSSLGNVAIKLSKPARSSSDNVNSNSCSRRFFFIAFSQHESRAQRYAPRPDFLPIGSSCTCPSGVRTMRSNSRLGLVSRQEIHVRKGTCLGFLVCVLALFVAMFVFPTY